MPCPEIRVRSRQHRRFFCRSNFASKVRSDRHGFAMDIALAYVVREWFSRKNPADFFTNAPSQPETQPQAVPVRFKPHATVNFRQIPPHDRHFAALPAPPGTVCVVNLQRQAVAPCPAHQKKARIFCGPRGCVPAGAKHPFRLRKHAVVVGADIPTFGLGQKDRADNERHKRDHDGIPQPIVNITRCRDHRRRR